MRRRAPAVRLVTRAASGVLAALHSEQIFAHARQLAVIEKENEPGSAKAKAARSALKDIALTLARLAQAAERGQRMGRLLLGEATQILGGEVALRAVAATETTPEAAQADLEALRRAIEYARERVVEPKLIGTGNGTKGAAVDGSAKPN